LRLLTFVEGFGDTPYHWSSTQCTGGRRRGIRGEVNVRLKKIVIENFKVLQDVALELNDDLNIIVGDNEAGKSTLLEAIDLVLSGQLHGRNIAFDLSPYLFNKAAVSSYFAQLQAGVHPPPPHILIEAYLSDDPELAALKGTNNSENQNTPGIYLRIDLAEAFKADFNTYVADPARIETIPVEYYTVYWRGFSNNGVVARSIPIKSLLVDTNEVRTLMGADKYVARIIDDVLDDKQRIDLAINYREMKKEFVTRAEIKEVNSYFADKQGEISDKPFTVSVDISAKSSWESALTPYLDDIPFSNSGKGEQSAVKMKLAMTASGAAHVFLIEEPENHLSYSRMHRLIDKIKKAATGKQIIIATHSSFVLNKLGVEKVILFNGKTAMKLGDLSKDTYEYFMKLPGHDTLRLILSKRAILVEGASDELVVQRAFSDKYGVSPLEKGVDVISVQSLAFKRFLEIAKLLGIDARVVTDNDGSVEKLKARYADYLTQIYYDKDEVAHTLEPQLLKANSLATLNAVLAKTFDSDGSLLDFMNNNKTDCALAIFASATKIDYPQYIQDVIQE
jgi:putative ATP-dependent endonuclease of the OLD family